MYKIRYIGDPVLRKPAQPITLFDEKLRSFIKEMTEIMYTEDGIGLAAPQIGFSKSLTIVDVSELDDTIPSGAQVFINPQIIESSGQSVVEEGCLSIPGVNEEVTRPDTIKMTYQNENGEEFTKTYTGWMARVLQHEIDHLNGILFVDHISPLKRNLLINQGAIPEIY